MECHWYINHNPGQAALQWVVGQHKMEPIIILIHIFALFLPFFILLILSAVGFLSPPLQLQMGELAEGRQKNYEFLSHCFCEHQLQLSYGLKFKAVILKSEMNINVCIVAIGIGM